MTRVVTLSAHPDGTLVAGPERDPEGHVSVAVNQAFLLEAVDACDVPDLTLELGSALHPVAIRPAEREGFVTLLMPVRL